MEIMILIIVSVCLFLFVLINIIKQTDLRGFFLYFIFNLFISEHQKYLKLEQHSEKYKMIFREFYYYYYYYKHFIKQNYCFDNVLKIIPN